MNLFSKLFANDDSRQFNKSAWFTALGTIFRYNNYAVITEIRADETNKNIVELILSNPIKCEAGTLLAISTDGVLTRPEDMFLAYVRYHLGPFIRISSATETINKLRTGMLVIPKVCAYPHIICNLPVSNHSQIQIINLGNEIKSTDALNLILKYCDIYEDDSVNSSKQLSQALDKAKVL